jgi:hypothetical protein
MKIKFPVIGSKDTHWPTIPLCPICKKAKVLEPHSMAVLNAGALKKIKRKKDMAMMSSDLEPISVVLLRAR